MTCDGSILNVASSVRPAGEPMHLVQTARCTDEKQTTSKCSHVRVLGKKNGDGTFFPLKFALVAFQAGTKPWGYEQGFNEKGVSVGLEPWASRLEEWHSPRLLGSDIVRLVLEQCDTAKDALVRVASLVETYGQGAVTAYCRTIGSSPYSARLTGKFKAVDGSSVGTDNIFLISDAQEAFVIEVVLIDPHARCLVPVVLCPLSCAHL